MSALANTFQLRSIRGAHVAGIISMVGIGFAMLVINQALTKKSEAPDDAGKVRVVQFNSAPPPPPKKEDTKPAPQQQKPQTVKAKAPLFSAPQVASKLTSVSFSYGSQDFGDPVGMANQVLGQAQEVTMTDGTVDVPPKATQQTAPQYPREARAKGITGFVTMELTIGTSGRVENAEVLEAKPEGVFDQEALAAVRQWNFVPGQFKGKAVRTIAKQTLRFAFE